MIARTWTGITRASDADAYQRYLEETGLAAFRKTPGNVGAVVLRRVDGERAEFLLVSFWEDEAAIRRFAGDEPEVAVFYPEDERFLIAREMTVDHWETPFADLPARHATEATS